MEDRWSETNSQTFLDRGRVFTPDRDGVARVIGDLIPADPADAFVAVDVCCGQGWLSAAVLARFPSARVVAHP